MSFFDNFPQEALVDLLKAYDSYISNAADAGLLTTGWTPVCVEEFYNTEYQNVWDPEKGDASFDYMYDHVEKLVSGFAETELPKEPAQAEPASEVRAFDDDRISLEAGQLMVQLSGEEEKRFLRSHIQDIKSGDAFIVGEAILTAEMDAHQNHDEPDEPWIVYDEYANGWFEEDITNADNEFRDQVVESLFIFDEELTVEDSNFTTVSGYIWATDGMVSRVRDQMKDKLSPSELESMENINFYPVYNLYEDTIDVEVHFHYTNRKGKEAAHGFNLSLSDSEAAGLKSVMKDYCQKTYNMSCQAFLEKLKAQDAHEQVFEALKNSLNNTLQDGEYGQFIDVCAEVPLAYSDKPNHVLVAWGEENDEDDKFFSLSINKTDANGRYEDQVPGMQVFSESEDPSELAPFVHKLLTDFDKLPAQERAGETKPLNAIISNAQQRHAASTQTTDKTNTKEPMGR